MPMCLIRMAKSATRVPDMEIEKRLYKVFLVL